MVLNKEIIGNFTPYRTDELKAFLKNAYAADVRQFYLYTNALDNTVIDVDHEYILKIYETKSFEHIKKAIELYENFKDYYSIRLVSNKEGKYLIDYKNKPALLYYKALGRRSNSLVNNLILMQKFHQFGYCGQRNFHLKVELNKIRAQTELYLCADLQAKLKGKARYKRYDAIFRRLKKIKYNDMMFEVAYGITHGDCNPNNILTYHKVCHFIDFDNISYNYQIYDLISLLLKYRERPIIEKEKALLRKRYFLQYENNDFDGFYDTINLMCCHKGLEMILSTEYYCFVINKFSEKVLDKYFMAVLNGLLENIEVRLKELKKCGK